MVTASNFFSKSMFPLLKNCKTILKFSKGKIIVRISVSPAYGYIGSALVKCSNEGGLGPRYNREEDPGSSIFSMLMVYG